MTSRAEPHGELRVLPTWSTVPEAVGLVIRGVTFRTAIVASLVVGTVLSLVNQGGVMLSGEMSAPAFVRIGVNYFVPYLVSSIGYLAPLRRRR